jgi:hypothetical protein
VVDVNAFSALSVNDDDDQDDNDREGSKESSPAKTAEPSSNDNQS